MNYSAPITSANFKALPCPIFFQSGKCTTSQCPYYHDHTDRRRPPYKNGVLVYKNVICQNLIKFHECPQNEDCPYAHNSCELKFHPDTLQSKEIKQSGPSYEKLPTLSPLIMQSQLLDIMTFKTKECIISEQHDQKYCLFYHSIKDKRRVPTTYTSEKCQFFNEGNCPLQDACNKSHNRMERLYHPEKYKTSFCNDFFQPTPCCSYNSLCCFAHSEEDVLIELIHNMPQDEEFFMFYFKTVWCPFNFDHNKALCLYAHNWQDFRRKPFLFEYYNESCPNWKSETFLCSYLDGCQNEANCKYCHGWKEQQYHPLEYKTKPCPEGKKCSRGGNAACPFFHSFSDMRTPDIIYKSSQCPKNINNIRKLHPFSNINDQKEAWFKMKASSIDTPVLKLKYTLFEEDERTKPKQSSYANRHAEDKKSLPLSVNSKCFIPKSVKEKLTDSLANILNKLDLIHLYYILNGKVDLNNWNQISQLNKNELYKLGVTNPEENAKLYNALQKYVTCS
jgi:hypothetical protein